MSIWKDTATPVRKDSAATEPTPLPPREQAAAPVATAVPAPVRSEVKESLIASGLTIEGKIEGSGHVRIAGRFQGDVNVQGNVTIESGAKLTGSVRAEKVMIAGELEGNIESAAQVELQASAAITGDVKAGSLSMAPGARMHGRMDCGGERTAAKAGRAEVAQAS
jgi:cytoskeletal protein CcmA (bactofilin family)